ncbi:hypothetical protein ODJ79_11800 [Actinoplanes sp. KI2]|uniref:hypothetical protein n=1 Tax=Actinoplanes sp. KI2 TaxID=2983315 RepID=UPI0021D5B3B3|nr:hypothetical protein [Actinoplanes sp. KI2]MCU7724400.1 hypothetical protein [Actinoplanes sp. KI2]
MNDVKFLCEQLLDAPPPMRDGAQVLAEVHRSTARRSAIRAGGGLAVTAALTGAAVFAAPLVAGHRPAPAVQAGASPAATPPSSPVPAEVPYAQAAGTHDRKMFQAMKRALPPGYAATSQYAFSTSRTPYPTDPAAPIGKDGGALLAANTSVLVSKDGRVGWLAADIVNDGKPVPAGDLCGPEIAKRNGDQPGTFCKTVDVNGTAIRVTREHWTNTAPEIDVITATRYLRNGALSITESRSVPDFQSEKDQLPPDAVNKHPKRQTPTSALGDWFLTADQLAALAADPAMLP